MALTATIYKFDVQLSDVDRNVYESLAIHAAKHPSETEEYLATRVLAYCLEYTVGITFTKGLAEPDTPAIEVRDLTGALRAWIEVGSPDAARLHKASKAAPRVVVYTARDPMRLVNQLAGERIHRAESIQIRGFDPAVIQAVLAHLDRRTTFELTVTDGQLYLTIGGATVGGPLTVARLGGPTA